MNLPIIISDFKLIIAFKQTNPDSVQPVCGLQEATTQAYEFGSFRFEMHPARVQHEFESKKVLDRERSNVLVRSMLLSQQATDAYNLTLRLLSLEHVAFISQSYHGKFGKFRFLKFYSSFRKCSENVQKTFRKTSRKLREVLMRRINSSMFASGQPDERSRNVRTLFGNKAKRLVSRREISN